MPVERVVVQGHLRVEGEGGAGGGHHQRVDLDQRGVAGGERVPGAAHDRRRVSRRRPRQPHRVGELPGLERREPEPGMVVDPVDQLRGRRRHRLDVHPARRARHHHRPARRPVHEHPEIQFGRHVEGLLDEQPPDDPAARPGLGRHQGHPQDLARDPLRLGGVPGDLDAPALAAAAGVDLRLDHDAPPEPARDGPRLGGREHRLAAGDRDVVAREQGLGLVLVDLHGESRPPSPAAPNAGRTPIEAPHRFRGAGSWPGERRLRLRSPPNQPCYRPRTSTSSLTAAADRLSAACSPGSRAISITCSAPPAPSFTGTPTKRSRMPYSPCR